ncbi:type I polyketide synthase [Nocardia arthritidis]|uniref:DUF1729 domain-containing protein n=1 Tax=Nocardia arthritidis TaxID=228602 RepID=A0A6G9YEB0_9NOCA|nr:type I polyketide synthase [Nocardia arthritidis]QIS11569.1 DUF1729 domain-containing protein [Nocardia arthritidis]
MKIGNSAERVHSGWRPLNRSTDGVRIPLLDRIANGERYALAFGGQGSDWLDSLAATVQDNGLERELGRLVDEAATIVEPLRPQLNLVCPDGFDPITWIGVGDSDTASTRPPDALTSVAISVPGTLLAQLAIMRALKTYGLDPLVTPPALVLGYSQGVLGVQSVVNRDKADVQLLATAQVIGAAARLVARRRGLISIGERMPMSAVSQVDPDRLRAVVMELGAGVDAGVAPVVAIRAGRRRAVVSGPPDQLDRVRRRCAQIATNEERQRAAKVRGGALFAPVFEDLPIEVGFHHPGLAETIELVDQWAARCGLDTSTAVRLASEILIEPVDWVASVERVVETGVTWVLDIGPGDALTRMTAPTVRGRGVGLVAASTRDGQRSLLTPGAAPEIPPAWSKFAPRPVTLPDGRTVTETAFTRLTGRSPILLAGMTPTTVDAKIVAAAANAGYWAELAGGGQVTEQILADRLVELRSLLEPGRAAQFNTLLLDPYLWNLHLGGKRLVQRARAAGAPIDGVVVSAGIPELDRAVALIEELSDAGIEHVAFKPGTVPQIREVLRIAREVPKRMVIVHIEGGRAGGHHSWEDLDDLLLETYAELRAQRNVVICAGGGIGTPERAAEYLTGTWSVAHGYPIMPVDGVLVGTAAMATLEATTSPQVKQMLVEVPGTADWVSAGAASGGIASGRSQLGADIHEIDNTASRTGRLLDEVAGDADAVQARRAEIIAALNSTAKPYFGDVATMTYVQWLSRYVELSYFPVDSGANWADISWRDRFAEMLQRAEARLHPADAGPIPTLFTDPDLLDRARDAIDCLIEAYPQAAATVLHPADSAFFISLCKKPGKPVNFVPVIDADIRRWWRSDSLWQAHDRRYPADQVCVIPGPVSVAGITRVDEPVADLLGRFERATTDILLQRGHAPVAVSARRCVDGAVGSIEVVLVAPDVYWAGRTTVNPVRRLGSIDEWVFQDTEFGASRAAVHTATGAMLVEHPVNGQGTQVELTVPLSAAGQAAVLDLRIRIGVPPSALTGGAPVITAADAESAMARLLVVAAGCGGGARAGLPEVRFDGGAPVARLEVRWTPEVIADHAGATAGGPGNSSGERGRVVPDVLVGVCWPAVFAVLGAATGPDGTRVIEGMLDLVHLDHQVRLLADVPERETGLMIRAEAATAVDTDLGRIVEVRVRVDASSGDGGPAVPTAELVERFVVRGRTGDAIVPEPPRAAGTVGDSVAATARRRRCDRTLTAPRNMSAFAEVSGDHNPIHTSGAAALLAGLREPIVHGMWLSAAAQHAISAGDSDENRPASTITAWTVRFVAPVTPGATIALRADRTAIDAGAEILEVSCRVDGEIVLLATGRVAPPRTVLAFPGQGVQRKGMGLAACARSHAARQIWAQADRHTRVELGFSILAVVRDNPVAITVRGIEHRHPDGVLNLTQFTQVALATLACAQVAELREAGVLVADPPLCGHSIGEFSALAAAVGVMSLETLLTVVFRRGTLMHALVPRDPLGRSNYRMAAIRPSEFGLSDAQVIPFVAEIASAAGEFLQVVNFNVRDAQYSVAGTVAGLTALAAEIDRRRAESGGKRAFIEVPGIDIPFHSDVLRPGVTEFRTALTELLPTAIDPKQLVGRYIPNLLPRLFALDRSFVAEVAALVPSEPLAQVLADFQAWSARPAELCRILLIELLAWQFASPVRWIETQDLLFTEIEGGGLGIERFVEVGLAEAPTVANSAAATVKARGPAWPVAILNAERDAAVLFGADTDPDTEAEVAESDDERSVAAPPPMTTSVPADELPVPVPSGQRPEDISFTAADATRVLLATWAKLRIDQIGSADTIETLCDGVSSRRNQVLVDLGAELSLGAIDGAADADMVALSATVNKMARTYKPFGPVLTGSLDGHLRKLLGPSGRRPDGIAERVRNHWLLGAGWAAHVTAELVLATRDGNSARGGELGDPALIRPGDGPAVDALIDAAVHTVANRHGVVVGLPADTSGASRPAVDAAALDELGARIAGRDGVLASMARLVLDKLALTEQPVEPMRMDNTELVDLVSAELGSEWQQVVTPVFDARRVVLFDDRWASARADLADIWVDSGANAAGRNFAGAGEIVAAQARWWRNRADAAAASELAELYERIELAAYDCAAGEFAADVAVVTGASAGSIGAAVIRRLLAAGATVVATTSRLDEQRLTFYRDLYRDNARVGAALWVVPANMASFSDVDALAAWIGEAVVDHSGGSSVPVKPALIPTLLFPFAAPQVLGTLSDAGARTELEMRVLLWSTERLIGGLAALGADTSVDARLHVVLPGSPNRGMFGGDGGYGEAKAALDAIVAKWTAERGDRGAHGWADRTTLVHAQIGWVRGTGLMGHNDPFVDAVEAAGVRTWSPDEIAEQLLVWCKPDARARAATEPCLPDLTGGLAEAELHLATRPAGSDSPGDGAIGGNAAPTIAALPAPPMRPTELPVPDWPEVAAAPEELVVIVGAGELGPCGSARTRFELEVEDRLSAAGVAELAWVTGMITWEHTPEPGWYDTATGDPVPEAEVCERYHDAVVARCGIRPYADDGEMTVGPDGSVTAPLLTSVYLDEDLTFAVRGEEDARAFQIADPEHTVIAPLPDSTDWQVTRRAGTEIRVPRRLKLTRTVGGQVPTGFDATRWGISPDLAASMDRVALWNVVTTVDAFLSAGFSPVELMRWVHPTMVANTVGTGMGGARSVRRMNVDVLLGTDLPNDLLQEMLPNIVAAHVVQSYIGSYGPMVHPVAACATAAVSVEEGVDKIRLGKADFVVAGGVDDIDIFSVVGFGAMSATADSAEMAAKGLAPQQFSRANDRRRGGFVESQGGGTVLLARGSVAAEHGLPVLGVVAYAHSFGDGIHTSIPAPGLGALGAARDGAESELATRLRRLGVAPDDVAVVSKHDTSTLANDPNEAELHERLADALGRSDSAPLFVISQKALTGHTKGGAAIFQLIGLCQVLMHGIIPPNRNLDCVDAVMSEYRHLVWPTEPLRFDGRYPLKAGLATSLGFGHVSSVLAVVHPEAFVQAIPAERRADYRRRAGDRAAAGRQRMAEAMCGGAPLYDRPVDRRLGDDGEPADRLRDQEARMLLDSAARLGSDGVYTVDH